MAKGVANGLPLGVTIATPEIAASLTSLSISTFGGNPVSCTSANATLQIIKDEQLPDNAERMGCRLRDGLEELQQRYPHTIGDVRGLGLMQGVELVEDEVGGDRTPATDLTVRLFEETKARGLLHWQGRSRRQCAAHRPGAHRGTARGRRGAGHPHRVVRRRRCQLT